MTKRTTTKKLAGAATAASIAGVLLAGTVAPASAAGTGFTPGDLVVEQVGATSATTPSSTSTAVYLEDYATNGTASGFQVALPTADSGTTHALTESGTATYDGELTTSADGHSVLVPGYDAAPGVSSLTSATGVARTVGTVDASGNVDTSTALGDSTTEGQNFRTAAGNSSASFYAGGGAGLASVPKGATSASTYLDSDNVHQARLVDGQLYESTTTAINAVGSGEPTSGTQTASPLFTGPSKFEPAGFDLVTLGAGPAADTLYVADTGNNAVEKYSLIAGTWTAEGSVAVPTVTGLVATVTAGVATIYVTGGTSTSAKYNSVLSKIVDTSGPAGVLAGTPTTLATAPTGTSFKGVDLAPTATVGAALPEAPLAVLLPLTAFGLAGGVIAVRRRRRPGATA